MMKTKLFLALAAGLMVASCAQKESPEVLPEVVDHDQTRYLSVSLSSPKAETKGFNDGEPAEHQVNSLYFVFYDESGKALDSKSFSDADFEDETLNDQFDPEGGNVTKFWTSVVPVNLKQGDNVPAYVMCFVNPINFAGIADMSLDQISQEPRQAVRSANGFPMTNSVYYGVDPITGVEGRMRATPIVASKLFDSEANAKKAAEAGETLDIYVERYAAKLSVEMAAEAVKDYTIGKGEDTHTLKFVPEFWRPNAIDENMFITKMFGTAGQADGTFDFSKTPTMVEMTAAFDEYNKSTDAWKTWNDSGNFRSYWACAPSYFNNDYPYVSDDVNDLDGNTKDYALKYFSYNEIMDTKNGAIPYAAGFNPANVFYSRETTANIKAIRNTATGNPAATVSSIVVVGKYFVDGAETASTFYIDKANDKYYADEAAVKTVLAQRQKLVYKDSEGKELADASYFVAEHPKKAVRGEIKVAGRYVTLQLSSARGFVYSSAANDGKGGYVGVTAANLAEVNKQLWAQVNIVEMYKDGLAFFYIPIRHLGFKEARCMTEDKKAYVWENSEIGDYGIVRNHAYSVKINSISGLGTGLRDENQPIVPPKDEVNYYIAARLNILAWNVVPQWSVDL